MACRQLPRLLLLRPFLLLGRSQFPLLKTSFVASNVVHPGLVTKNPSGVGPSLPPGRMGFSSMMSVYPWSSKLLLTRTQLETPTHLQQECTRVAPSILQFQQRQAFATKLKKTKIKAYSSYKKRFRALANGLYKRWRSGKRHNAHSKTNKQKRQLRRPSVAPHALATVMKKLNFLG